MSETRNFAAAMARLEEIVSLLESGSAGLEESLALFEEGVKLAADCEKRLTAAKQKITSLSQAEQEVPHDPS